MPGCGQTTAHTALSRRVVHLGTTGTRADHPRSWAADVTPTGGPPPWGPTVVRTIRATRGTPQTPEACIDGIRYHLTS